MTTPSIKAFLCSRVRNPTNETVNVFAHHLETNLWCKPFIDNIGTWTVTRPLPLFRNAMHIIGPSRAVLYGKHGIQNTL